MSTLNQKSSYRDFVKLAWKHIYQQETWEGKGNIRKSCERGLQAWEYIKKAKQSIGAESLCDNETLYEFMYWASSFTIVIHNAHLEDKSLEEPMLKFLETFVLMHKDYKCRDLHNLDNFKIHLGQLYFNKEQIEKANSFFEAWLTDEPDCFWG